MPVTASHEVWPEAREYERTALSVMNAYVQPKVRRYLEGFEAALTTRAVPAVPYVTKSNGGIMPVAAARSQTVSTLPVGHRRPESSAPPTSPAPPASAT